MRALAFAVAAPLLAGCPSPGACPVDTVSSASQCVPIDMAVPDMTELSSTCPPESAFSGTGTVLPPCLPSTTCFYPVGGDDGGMRPQECQCMTNHHWFCYAK